MKTFDGECYKLAEYFLDGYVPVAPDSRSSLAAAIQEAIENWLDDRGRSIDAAAEAALDAHIDAQIDERRIDGKQAAHDE